MYYEIRKHKHKRQLEQKAVEYFNKYIYPKNIINNIKHKN